MRAERRATEDMAERMRGKQALRELNETLEARVIERTAERDQMWATSPDLMLIIDFDGIFRRVNPAWTTVLGYLPAELIGHHLNAFVVPDDHASTIRASQQAAGGGQVKIENRYRHKDGSIRHIAWVAAPSGHVTYATGRDVTAERRRDAELAAAQNQLRQSQKMEAVGQLTGGLAHDFNNLLTGIMGNLELLSRRVALGKLEGIERYVGSAQGAGRRAAALTQRLLAFARRQTLDPRPTDVDQLLHGMEDLLRRSVGSLTDVDVVRTPHLWPADIDAGQLENAVLNLCINGRDAMPLGGTLTVRTANVAMGGTTAQEHQLEPGDYISVCVTDTGSGMDEETAGRAFEPFFTTKPLCEGTGLGLSMVYGFARQSRGQVTIRSAPGQGTTVCIHLPRYHGVLPAAAGETRAQPLAGSLGQTVLVVEDESSIRHLLDEVLGDLGYAVLDAADGAGAVKVLESRSPIDLLITDVGLPDGMNGRQVADVARKLRPGLKVLFITGFADNAAVGNGHLEPGMELLTKPFTLEALAAKVADMLKP